ncbi:Flagellar biosynthesis protein FliQ [Candidatus Desulfofervidus auxilii]|uniref:Flagellar biosynthetic protein FliQ n=1 Tax=Desulfofervidus auxilii TaxID=1621989 RepID=A0A7C1VN08_DESA2|nr:flagellar biosynthesis protein FliQ [Candidatus Desulfofervidus auxilii]CAD7772971.1 Bacterial export proteins, family 3 [Candidatus Methanoperedenaceae archaeon GB50]CAD7774489.1 Bacterial export proteins, family 3 [Candidatus Methanoperedenaceae archaeon GB37]AMM40548.1 Flagellar biosynthesis protein FliQ [Candidatus Desulfofervidus auxilii]CAD7783397.1 MAG: Bacterial export proteins, family 3 [Candidatus Methanoperedenaceae archaeon GB37]HEC67522.1 flagellar biosynthesis protein FliQ [Ca
MTPEFLMGFARQAIETMLLVSAPLLGVALLVGLLIAIFQAITQVHEMTLTFVPKIVAVMLMLLFLLPWISQKIICFTQNVIISIAQYGR